MIIILLSLNSYHFINYLKEFLMAKNSKRSFIIILAVA